MRPEVTRGNPWQDGAALSYDAGVDASEPVVTGAHLRPALAAFAPLRGLPHSQGWGEAVRGVAGIVGCGQCGAYPTRPCPEGTCLGRFARARQKGLIGARDYDAAAGLAEGGIVP